MSKNTITRDLTSGSVPKQLILFAAPLLLSGMLQTLYNMVDMIVVGNIVGSSGLSAVSLGGEVLIVLTFIAMGFSNAGQIIISQYIGAKKTDLVKKMIGTLFTFLFICSLTMTILCLIFRENILSWVNTPPEALKFARSYLTVCISGLIFIYGYNLVSAILRGMGDSRHPFIFIAIASIINLILDIVFVGILKLNTFGAALATVIGQGVSFLCAIIFLYRKREEFGFDFKFTSFRIDIEVFKTLVKLGIPMVLQSAAISFSKLYISSWVNTYGVIASAVTGIGNKVQMFTNVFSQALSTSGASMIAQNIGAEKFERVPKIVKTSFIVVGVIATTLSVITLILPRLIFGIFTNEIEVLDMAMIYIPVVILMYASCVFRAPMISMINGSGNSKLNLMIAVLDGLVVRIGLATILGFVCGFGIYGFWYGNAISGFMPFVIGFPYYLSGKWKTRRHVLKEK